LVCDATVCTNRGVAGRVAWVAVNRALRVVAGGPEPLGLKGCCERGGAWMLQHDFPPSLRGGPDGRLRECCRE
jgi:hypothetical protein